MSFNSSEIEAIIKYTFKNKDLLRCAFTHSSYSRENGKGIYNNERLEFLGDSVLGFIVADHLFRKKGRNNEGKMTREKQSLVSKVPLGLAIESIGLQKYLIVGESMENVGANISSCENLFEAIVAAIYLDGGLESAKQFIYEFLIKNADKGKSSKITSKRDSKSELQEKMQSKKLGTPKYELISKTGPDHDPLFTIGVVIGGKTVAVGQGKNKSDASKDAATRALKKLTGRNN